MTTPQMFSVLFLIVFYFLCKRLVRQVEEEARNEFSENRKMFVVDRNGYGELETYEDWELEEWELKLRGE